MSRKKNKVGRRERRHTAAIKRVKAKSQKTTGGFDEKYRLENLEKKRRAELRKIAEKKKASYENRHKHNRSFYEDFKKDHDISEIIKAMWDRGYKIQVDDYYKDFIDEHEDVLTKSVIDDIMQDKFEREERELQRQNDFWDDDNDPFAAL